MKRFAPRIVKLLLLAGAVAACDSVLGLGDYKDRVAGGDASGGGNGGADGAARLAELTGLHVSAGVLQPAFDPAVVSYDIVPSATSLGVPFTVTPTAAAGGSVTVNGTSVLSGNASPPIALNLLVSTKIDVAASRHGVAAHYIVTVPAVQEAYVKASRRRQPTDAQEDAPKFGTSVALSADGSTLAVGAPYEYVDNQTMTSGDPPAGAGAVYVCTRNGATWDPQAQVTASFPRGGAEFGAAVALSADGSTLVVGSASESSSAVGVGGDERDTRAKGSGAAFVFSRGALGWTQQAYIKASNTRMQAQFGYAVALSSTGDTLAVGALLESSKATGTNGSQSDQSDTSAYGAGAVYVFSRGMTWSQQAYVKASNTQGDSKFGSSVALSADGRTMAVGAIFEGSNATGIDGDQLNTSAPGAGAVYVFSKAGVNWAQEAYVKASNTQAGATFGDALALSSDGSTLAVGSTHESSAATGINGQQSDISAPIAGAVYLFSHGVSWTQDAYVKAGNTRKYAAFGVAVALSGDGHTLAVGAAHDSSFATGINGNANDMTATNAGAGYLFSREGTTWSQYAYVKASNTRPDGDFAASLALSSDGTTLAVGSPGESSGAVGVNRDESDTSASGAGAVYVLR